MYNDRHWLTDVAAGAGIGILCTKTYWLYQKCKNYFSKETKNVSYDCSFYNGKEAGIGLVGQFNISRNFHQFGFYDTTK
jgi:hypothetical protein